MTVVRKILLACPSNDGTPDYTTSLSMGTARIEGAAKGWQVDPFFRLKDSCIERARDIMFSMFYASDYDDLLQVDSDIGWQPGDFSRIMEHPVDVVGGAYRGRSETEMWVARPLNGHFEFDKDQPTGLMEAMHLPTGFLRITRRCAQKMVEAYADDWYHDSTAPPINGEPLKIYHLFEFVFRREHRHLQSEDYTFCEKWRAIGGRCWLDPFLTLTHTGKQAWRGQFLEYLKRTNAPRPQSIVDAARAAAEEQAA